MMQRVDLRKIARAAEARQRYLTKADEKFDEIVDELVSTEGDRRNIKAASHVSGIARTTLHRAIKQREQQDQ